MLDSTPVRGMRDILPDEMRIRDQVQSQIASVYQRWGFDRIDTPALERIELLESGQGGENEKLIFKILKRGDKLDLQTSPDVRELVDSGLRFDLTVPLARYFAANAGRLAVPLKVYQIGPVWRAERPQKGRFRQFTQCDIDVIGMSAPAAEVDLILATAACLRAVGLDGFRIRLNDRRVLHALVKHCGFLEADTGMVLVALDKVDKMGLGAITRDLAAADQSSVKRLLEIIEAARLEPTSACEFARRHSIGIGTDAARALDFVTDVVSQTGGRPSETVFDPLLVRGMGYYTGMIFEAAYAGYSYSIAGGGRYDDMISRFSSRSVPACGFSLGFERIVTILAEQRLSGPSTSAMKRVAVIAEGSSTLVNAHRRAHHMRQGFVSVSVVGRKKRLNTQLEELTAQGFSEFWLVPESGEVRQLSTRSTRTGDLQSDTLG